MSRESLVRALRDRSEMVCADEIYGFVDQVHFLTAVPRALGVLAGITFFFLLPRGGGWGWKLTALAFSLAVAWVVARCLRLVWFDSIRKRAVDKLEALLQSCQGHVLVLGNLALEDRQLNRFLWEFLPMYAEYD